jgi:hypothetical protein
MEDLAECQAEVIQPIKYEYKAKEGQDGVSLWEVSPDLLCNTVYQHTHSTVPTKWARSHSIGSPRDHRSPRGGEGYRCT